MSTYVRSDLQFPIGSESLMKLVDGLTGSPVDLLNNNLDALVGAFAGGTTTDASVDLRDGTTLNIHGSWSIDISGNPLTVSGHVDSAVRVLTGTSDALETVDHFTADFSGTYDYSTGQTSADFSGFAPLYTADDHIYGGSQNDLLMGFGGNDTIVGHGGRDHLYGDNGNDHLSGGLGGDKLIGGSGIDVLNGGAGNDVLKGGNGADHLVGNGGSDGLYGGSGHDVLDGGAGGDFLSGGGGYDTFVFHDHFGGDAILDFDPSNHEKIDLSHVTAITSFSDLIHHHLETVTDGGLLFNGNAEITVGAHNSIILVGIHTDQFGHGLDYSAHNFIF